VFVAGAWTREERLKPWSRVPADSSVRFSPLVSFLNILFLRAAPGRVFLSRDPRVGHKSLEKIPHAMASPSGPQQLYCCRRQHESSRFKNRACVVDIADRAGAGAVSGRADKFFNLLADWPSYMSPLALRVLPFSAPTFMHIVGLIEMVVGLAILTKWTRTARVKCCAGGNRFRAGGLE